MLGHLKMTCWQTTKIRDGVAAPRKAVMRCSREDNVTVSFIFRDTTTKWCGYGWGNAEADLTGVYSLTLLFKVRLNCSSEALKIYCNL